jgi:hypothetical protein
MFPIHNIKKNLNNLSSSIRLYKKSFRECQKNYSNLIEYVQWRYGEKSPHSYFYSTLRCLKSSQYKYRYLHIAYSLLKGKKYYQIESKTRDGNKIKIDDLNQIFTEFCVLNKITEIPTFELSEENNILNIKIKDSEELPKSKNFIKKLANIWGSL